MEAKQCDRCKELYSIENYCEESTAPFMIYKSRGKILNGYLLDLCPSCSADLSLWFTALEDKC